MAKKIATPALIKAVENLNRDIEKFRLESSPETGSVDLYENANTTRTICPDFKLKSNGDLTWTEDGKRELLDHFDADDIRDTIKFWRACLRRTRKYWEMDVETLDAIQEGEIDDPTTNEQ